MKRLLKITAILFLVGTNLLWGRFYAGIEGGYLGDKAIYEVESKNGGGLKKELKGNGGFGSFIFGTEHLFGKNYYGVRWGLSVGYGQTLHSNSDFGDFSYRSLWAGASFDMIFNFYAKNDFMTGMFMGVEYDFMMLEPSKKIDFPVDSKTNTHNIAVRVGLSTLFANHHRLELMAKIPVWMQEKDKKIAPNEYELKYEYIQGLLAYKYVF